MYAHKLPHRNPSSDEEERCTRNQTLQSRNSSTRFPSSSRIRKSGETMNSGKFIPLNPNQWFRRDRTVGETSTWDRIPNKVLIHDESDESDDEWMCRDDEYDSDDLSLETAKNSKWLRDFFGWLDSLREDQIDDPTIKMHCPACKDGAGAIVWYKGFHAVITHAENLRSKRVRLHRKFAEILEGELRDRRSTFSKHEEFSEWKGLGKEVDDQMIVWPPMVIIQNTRSHMDETGKWVGVEKVELLNCFKNYDIKKVKSAYGPTGHCGLDLLIFESSARGYVEAERLHKQLLEEGRGKYEYQNHRGHKYSDGERYLYGHMATEEDMELFYKHSKGKQKHKFEMKSHKMMVVDPLKEMEENGDKLIELETKVARETQENKILMETNDAISQKLRLRELEIQTIRRRTSAELEESKQEMEYMVKYYADVIKQLAEDHEMKLEEMRKLLSGTYL